LNGAREVQEQVLEKLPNAKMAVYVVWVPSYSTDNFEFTKKGMAIFKDKRVKQYWDGDLRIAGEKGYGSMISLPRDAPIAYDVYMYFKKGVMWGEKPPKPIDYMHQVFDDGKWFDPKKFVDAVKLLLKS
jgi:hypothetical protein